MGGALFELRRGGASLLVWRSRPIGGCGARLFLSALARQLLLADHSPLFLCYGSTPFPLFVANCSACWLLPAWSGGLSAQHQAQIFPSCAGTSFAPPLLQKSARLLLTGVLLVLLFPGGGCVLALTLCPPQITELRCFVFPLLPFDVIAQRLGPKLLLLAGPGFLGQPRQPLLFLQFSISRGTALLRLFFGALPSRPLGFQLLAPLLFAAGVEFFLEPCCHHVTSVWARRVVASRAAVSA